jgi:hypothetical protein
MGQYYLAYVKGEDERVFCPQNAIYMTKNGIKSARGIKERSYNEDPNSWGSCFSGLKLMEHSWLENDFVNGVLESIWENPCNVAWVGDYAYDDSDFDERYTKDTYETVWGEGQDERERPFDEVPTTHRDGYILNLDKGVYIDLRRYASVAGFKPKWSEDTWTIQPLPLLTCIGNGRGGGDYWGTCMDMVGSWAMDRIEFTEEWPSTSKEIDYNSIKFAED